MIASTAMTTAIAVRLNPLTAAERISARFSPNVQIPLAGRAARRAAHKLATSAPTSVSRCPASANRTSDPESAAATASPTIRQQIRPSAIAR